MWDAGIRKNIFQKITTQKYSMVTSSGETIEFTRRAFGDLIKEDSFRMEVELALAEAYLITSKTVSAEDVSYEDAGEDG
jgi:hypothetical protein